MVRSPAQSAQPIVLVVDDSRDSRLLARRALSAGGFGVAEVADGRSALLLLETMRVDVLLVDVCMPGMDGYEVCRAVRARPETSRLPVILMSSRADGVAINEGFAAGGVDYLAKPFRPDELRARVAVHAELNQARRELEESHARLAALNREKDQMFGVAAHDLRGPLAVIAGFADHALSRMRAASADAGGPFSHALEVIRREADQMNQFITTLLDLNSIERGGEAMKPRLHDFAACARAAIERFGLPAGAKNIMLRGPEDAVMATVRVDATALRRVLDNLLSNAVKFTPAGGTVTLSIQADRKDVRCTVADSGPGLAPADLPRVFQRFARLSARPTAGEKSTGLGLAITHALVERMGGRIWCGNNSSRGAFFAFSLPLVDLVAEGTAPATDGEAVLIGADVGALAPASAAAGASCAPPRDVAERLPPGFGLSPHSSATPFVVSRLPPSFSPFRSPEEDPTNPSRNAAR